MADGAYRWLGNAPEPEATRVAEIEAGWDEAEAGAFAEPARTAVVERVDRTLIAVRTGDLASAAERLDEVRAVLTGLSPDALEPRGGLAGLFDSRAKRLKRFRENWRGAVADLTDAASGLSERVADADRRSAALDGAWVEVRDAVGELDAHLAVASSRLKGAALTEDAGAHPLKARSTALNACRAAALQTLSLIRVAQNADARAAGSLKACLDEVTIWRDDWQDALGLAGKRPRKVRPDPERLVRSRDALLARTDRGLAELATARARRAEVEGRMAELRAHFQG
jgi:chromosome segregation ATPase